MASKEQTSVPRERIIEAVKDFRNGAQDAATTILLGQGTPKKKEAAFRRQIFALYKACEAAIESEIEKIEVAMD